MILRALIARGTAALHQGAFLMQRGTPAYWPHTCALLIRRV